MSVQENKSTKVVMIIAVIALLAIVAFAIMQAPDRRSTGERIGDAISNLGNGVEDASDAMKDQTPAQKLGNAVEDAGDKVKRAAE